MISRGWEAWRGGGRREEWREVEQQGSKHRQKLLILMFHSTGMGELKFTIMYLTSYREAEERG